VLGNRYAAVSCHVEAPLDDRVWKRFSDLQGRTPGGFRIAALIRPPADGESEQVWLERARQAAGQGSFGHHAHFVSATHARPSASDPAHAARVRTEAEWLRGQGLDPRFFCGGGWYIDEDIAEAIGELGYVDCTAVAFRPSYLAPDATWLHAGRPTWLLLPSGRRLLELPATHSLGMAARAALDPQPLADVVHVYFHDTDLLDPKRRLVLELALRVLGRRRRPVDLDTLAQDAARSAPEKRLKLSAFEP
jgi:hypothetical protein